MEMEFELQYGRSYLDLLRISRYDHFQYVASTAVEHGQTTPVPTSDAYASTRLSLNIPSIVILFTIIGLAESML